MEHLWNDTDSERPKQTYSEKNLPQSHFTLHSSHWTETGSNPGLFREMPAPTRTNVCQFLSPLHKCPQQRITSKHPCVTALTTYPALPERLTGAQLVKVFVLFYGTRNLINIFTTTNIYTTSCARRMQLNSSDYISFHVCIFRQERTQLTEIQNQFVLTTLKPPCGWHACGQAGWMMPHDSSFSVLYEKH